MSTIKILPIDKLPLILGYITSSLLLLELMFLLYLIVFYKKRTNSLDKDEINKIRISKMALLCAAVPFSYFIYRIIGTPFTFQFEETRVFFLGCLLLAGMVAGATYAANHFFNLDNFKTSQLYIVFITICGYGLICTYNQMNTQIAYLFLSAFIGFNTTASIIIKKIIL